MAKFPPLTDLQRKALFLLVEETRKRNAEGISLAVTQADGVGWFIQGEGIRIEFPYGQETLRILDSDGYLVMHERRLKTGNSQFSIESSIITFALDSLAYEFYDWWRKPWIVKQTSKLAESVMPDFRTALVSTIVSAVVTLTITLLINRCSAPPS